MQAVTYACQNADPSAATAGGQLVRFTNYAVGTVPSCAPAGVTGAVVASRVGSCSMVYDPNQGATQQSGYLQVQLQLREAGETIILNYGAHVDNVP